MKLTWNAYKDVDAPIWRLRKVVVEVWGEGGLLYRQRYLTALLPGLKRALALFCIRRLLRIASPDVGAGKK